MRTITFIMLAVSVVALAGAAEYHQDRAMKKLTPIIIVEEIEPCLGFWVERLGFAKTIEVPDGDALGFAAVESGAVEVMYQSRASVAADVPALAEGALDRSGALFIEVESLDEILPKLEGVEVVVPERTTFYGAREIFVRAPCGTVVGFAEMTEEQ
jgi:uncharacterized glyoxalase superfamily protein PhnB